MPFIRRNYEGYYKPNCFTIFLSPENHIFNDEGKLLNNVKKNTWLTLYHEFWYYWLNISTISAYRDFYIHFAILKNLSENIPNKNRKFNNNKKLDEKATELITLNKWLNGGQHQITNLTNIQFKELAEYNNGKYSKIYNGCIANVNHIIGSFELDESLARTIENIINTRKFDREIIYNNYPYNMFDIFDKYFNVSTNLIERAGMGIISFQNENTMKILYDLYLEKSNGKQMTIDNLKKIWDNGYKKTFLSDIEQIKYEIDEMCNEIVSNRGTLKEATKYICSKFICYLEKRLVNPLFDLENILKMCESEDVPINPLTETKVEFNLVQEGKNANTYLRDSLFQLYSDNDKVTEYYKTFEALFHSIYSILLELEENQCPFYYFCNLPNRENNAEKCQKEPWVFLNEKENCWYNNGLASIIYKMDSIKKKQQTNNK